MTAKVRQKKHIVVKLHGNKTVSACGFIDAVFFADDDDGSITCTQCVRLTGYKRERLLKPVRGVPSTYMRGIKQQ